MNLFEIFVDIAWQDLVFSVGQVVFIAALVPALLAYEKPPAITSIAMGTVLLVFAVAFISLSLWFAAGTVAIVGCLWYVLAGQKILQNRR